MRRGHPADRTVEIPRRGHASRFFLRFRTGINGSPMPSFKDAATDDEMWHLANYVVSLARKPAWELKRPT